MQLFLKSNFTFVYDSFQNFLSWMSQNPVGLKLNPQLSYALTTFCQIHLKIWQSYSHMLTDHIEFVISVLKISTFFGLSLTLSLISDLFSLLTLHFYCFYIYAVRLFRLEVVLVNEMSRLFRGKKYNPLHNRVDSLIDQNDTARFILGSLLFAICIFLFPTVTLYYFVFLLIRLLCYMTKQLSWFLISELLNSSFFLNLQLCICPLQFGANVTFFKKKDDVQVILLDRLKSSEINSKLYEFHVRVKDENENTLINSILCGYIF